MKTLAAYLEDNKIKRREFAERAEISQPYLHRILTGERTPSMAVLKRIVAATDGVLTYADLID